MNAVIPSSLDYDPDSFTLTNGTAMTSVTPTVNGGDVVTWSIAPSLPGGLSFSTTDGTISGTPTELSTATTYTVTATNTGGSDTATVSITVNDVTPSGLDYDPDSFTLTNGTAMTSVTPSITGVITSWSISPSLPAGLTFSTTDGTISGTPTELSANTTYTVTATNTGGSETANITITVNAVIPSSLDYDPDTYVLTNGTAMTSVTPTVSGGEVVTWTISATLPAGLTFSTTDGTISGTPTELSTLTTYTVTATNTGGSDTATVTITVNDVIPSSLDYSPDSFTLTNGTAMTSVTPTVNGGDVVTWSISPALPGGLSFDTSDGTISGTPTELSTSTTYTITATNTGGSDTDTVTITVNAIVPSSLDYDPDSFTLTNGTAMTSVTPTVNGGDIVTWSISPTLPGGLTFSTTDGTISGTPTELSTSTTYTVTATNTGGSDTATVTITVNAVIPSSLDYDPSTFTLTNGTAMTSVTPTVSGGDVVTWSISPSLSAGLSFDTTDGTISGTPTELSTATTYTITATNTGGSDTATVTITVNAVIPSSLDYSPDSFTLTNGTAMTSVTPTVNGGAITSWTISATLPAGLTFSTTDGTISGTPTELSTSTTYTITATNSGGSDTATVTITVNAVTPSGLDYDPDSFTLTNGTAMTSVTPTVNGGAITSWSISPSLPSGLTFETSNGTVWGRPTIVSSTTTYTITATNTGGSDTATVTITVNDVAPSSLTYSPNSFTLTNGTAMTSVTPSVNGGDVTSWTISATLPAGLTFSTTDGTISGTPTELSTATTYTVTATNTGGSDTATVTITVNAVAPSSLDYDPDTFVLSNGTAMTSVTPTVNGGDITSWTISATLPAGLTFSTADGTISGTPTELSTATTYTITATNTGGSDTATVTITVNDVGPNGLDYDPDSFTLTNGTAMTSVTPTINGGAITSWSISPSLPAGLTFSTTDGTISGTPMALSTLTTYTVTATNSGGSDTATVNVTVNAVIPSGLDYSPDTFTLTNGTAMTSVTPTVNGGAITSWTISATLPAGLTFSTTDGTISGTPTELSTSTTYTVTATNSGGSDTANVTITVNAVIPSGLDYDPDSFTLTNGTAMTSVTPSVSGGAITSWSISPSLPNGLTFSTTDGTISGTPTALSTNTTYTVTATNSGGSDTATVNITVNAVIPSGLDYDPDSFTLTNGTAMTSVTPTVNGGAATSWTISATLPAGLTFSTTDGTISGTPTELSTATTYTITAANTGGSDTTTVTITVNAVAPTGLDYDPDTFVLTNGTAMTAAVPSVNGGDITSWSISSTLPAGLTFSTTDGTISGTPTELSTLTSYTITATNSGGSDTTTVNITVNEVVPSLGTVADQTYTRDVGISTLTVVNSGGDVVDWSITPSLPTGLTFNNGVIDGKSDVNMTTTLYTVYAENTGGNVSVQFNITVNEPVADLSITDQVLTKDSDVGSITVTNIGGQVATWGIHPALPSGLTFANGTISGTPSVNQTAPVTYTVYANNSGGAETTTFTVTINEPQAILSIGDQVFTRGTDVGTVSVTNTGGAVVTWGIHPALPNGLVFANGDITGTPSANQTSAVTYTVYANNSGGQATTTFDITVNEPMAVLSLANQTYQRDVDIGTVNVTNDGGAVVTWGIHPALPNGLNFENGTLSGTPTVNMTTTAFTLYANNSGGNAVATFNITINEQLPVLQNMSDVTYTRGVTITPIQYFGAPIVFSGGSGGVVDEWGIHPSLPQGLSLENGVLSGTPQVNLTTTPFTLYANNSGGSVSQTFDITINEPLVSMTDIADQVYTRNDSITTLTVQTSGGVTEIWGIHPAVPYGLTFENGTLSGTPLVNLSTTAFTVFANNSGGSSNLTFNITVNEPVAALDEVNDFTFTRTVAISDHVFVFNDGVPATWAIEPSLPNGLTLTNGVLSGTPTQNLTVTSYTVYANNSGGSSSTSFNITVLEPAPLLAGSSGQLNLTRAVSTGLHFTVNNTGGEVANWSISPALPAGLVFNHNDGSVSGTPNVNATSQTFTVTAINNGGSDDVSFVLVINEPLAVLTYTPNTYTGDVSVAITDMVPTNSGGNAASWAIHPALPAGVTFNATTGVISGTPTVTLPLTEFTVYANNTGGSAATQVHLHITGSLPNLTASPSVLVLTRGTTMESLTVVNSGSLILEWGIEPSLPSGLSFGADNATIFGTPLVNSSAMNYSVWARNAVGNASYNVSITILEPAPNLTLAVTEQVLTRGTLGPVIQPVNNGGAIAAWSLDGVLPAGLMFNSTTGAISGTPSVNMSATVFTITASNLNNISSVVVTLTVNEPLPNVSSEVTSAVLVVGQWMTPVVFNSSGGVVANWAFNTTLPDGLFFNANNQSLYGMPTTPMNFTMFHLTGTNTGGSNTTAIDLRIIPPAANLDGPTVVVLVEGEPAVNLTFTNTGGPVANLTANPELPNGLTLDLENLSIVGTPTSTQSNVSYTLTAVNEAGTDTWSIVLRIIEPQPDITTINAVEGMRGDELSVVIVNNTGGTIENYTIEPALPDGLNFSLANLTVYGAATAAVPEGSWTLSVWNEDGMSTSVFIIDIVDIPPDLSFFSSSVVIRRGELTDGYTVANLGGNVTNWSVTPDLPDGLFFNASNGTLYGTPSATMNATTYNFTGTNSGGSSTVLLTIDILEPLPAFTYETMVFVLNNGSIAFTPEVLGNSGLITAYSIEPPLPEGLFLNNTSGEIYGQPVVAMDPTEYTVTAVNEDGMTNLTVVIEIQPPAGFNWEDVWNNPLYMVCGSFLVILLLVALAWFRMILIPFLFEKRTFEYNFKKTVVYVGEPLLSRAALFAKFGEVPDTLEPFRKGLDPVTRLDLEQFSVEPDLPYGMVLNEETGVIDGTPAERAPNVKYTVFAYVKKKRYKAVVSIEVRANQAMPEEGSAVKARDYAEANEATYSAAGLTREGTPAPSEAEAAKPEKPKTRAGRKQAKQRRKAEKKQNKLDAKLEANQAKLDAKAAKKQAKLDRKQGKIATDEESEDDDADEVSPASDGGQAERRAVGGKGSTRTAPEEEQEAAPPSPKFEGDLLTRQAQTAVDWDQDDYIRTREEQEAATAEPEVVEEEPEDEPEQVIEGTQHELQKGADRVEMDSTEDLPYSGNGWIGHPERGFRIAWTGIEGNTLVGVTGVKRKLPAGSVFFAGRVHSDEPEPEPEPEPETVPEPEPEPEPAAPATSRRDRKRKKKTEHGDKPVPEQVPPKQTGETGADISSETKKGATTLTLADASALPTEGAAWIGSAERGMHITWTGIDGNTLTGVKGIRRKVPPGARIILEEAPEEEEEESDVEPRFKKF